VYHSTIDLRVIDGFGETVWAEGETISASGADPARKALEKTSAAQVPHPA